MSNEKRRVLKYENGASFYNYLISESGDVIKANTGLPLKKRIVGGKIFFDVYETDNKKVRISLDRALLWTFPDTTLEWRNLIIDGKEYDAIEISAKGACRVKSTRKPCRINTVGIPYFVLREYIQRNCSVEAAFLETYPELSSFQDYVQAYYGTTKIDGLYVHAETGEVRNGKNKKISKVKKTSKKRPQIKSGGKYYYLHIILESTI